MTVAIARLDFARVSCYWRAVILGGASAFLLSLFWFASRYPQLLGKAKHIGQVLPSMAYSRVSIAAASDASVWMRILDVAVNWLDGMKIGMTFGVLFGALLHTVLRYYPLKIGNNLYLNSLKGALVGVPMGLLVLALKILCGFSTAEIALRLFTSEANVPKRLGRARERLRQAPLDVETPTLEKLGCRLPGVHGVLYLLFHEGYLSAHPQQAIRRELCDEALRLATPLAQHPVGAVPESFALLALMHPYGEARIAPQWNGRPAAPGGARPIALGSR
jgi:hypothetical protein